MKISLAVASSAIALAAFLSPLTGLVFFLRSTGVFLLALVFLTCYIIAWIFAMGFVTEAAEAKGYTNIKGRLWFIGLFGLIFTPALIVSVLPDKSRVGETLGDEASSDKASSDDDPSNEASA